MLLSCALAISTLPLAFAAPCYLHQNTTTNGTMACDLSTIRQPASALTPPSLDLRLILVVRGVGTQNFTCATPLSTPAAVGAAAELFNASCEVASPDVVQNNLIQAASIGSHFFSDLTTPDFDIPSLGNTKAKKVEELAAPNPSINIKWLKLQAQPDSTSKVKYVYRLNTDGGLAPTNCTGRSDGEMVTVQYQAQYWVYS